MAEKESNGKSSNSASENISDNTQKSPPAKNVTDTPQISNKIIHWILSHLPIIIALITFLVGVGGLVVVSYYANKQTNTIAGVVQSQSQDIQKLTENQRQVILLYYQQHLTMKQIAEVLEITESRVSQVHSSALFNLSVKLRLWKDDRI